MKSAISHNKFMIRIRAGVPAAVWTGGTNFSEGGIFGQSNVGEVVEDAAIATQVFRSTGSCSRRIPPTPR